MVRCLVELIPAGERCVLRFASSASTCCAVRRLKFFTRISPVFEIFHLVHAVNDHGRRLAEGILQAFRGRDSFAVRTDVPPICFIVLIARIRPRRDRQHLVHKAAEVPVHHVGDRAQVKAVLCHLEHAEMYRRTLCPVNPTKRILPAFFASSNASRAPPGAKTVWDFHSDDFMELQQVDMVGRSGAAIPRAASRRRSGAPVDLRHQDAFCRYRHATLVPCGFRPLRRRCCNPRSCP